MKGWYGQSHRHYLAAKGIKTNYYARNKKGDMFGFRSEIKLVDPVKIKTFHSVDRSKVEEIKLSGDINKPVSVTLNEEPEKRFKYDVFDGHHRVTAAIERGDSVIPIKIFKNKEKKYRRQTFK